VWTATAMGMKVKRKPLITCRDIIGAVCRGIGAGSRYTFRCDGVHPTLHPVTRWFRAQEDTLCDRKKLGDSRQFGP
jgi:hypothetical protein